MTREQLIDAINYLLERHATCPQVAAAVIRTLSVALLLAVPASAAPAPSFVPVTQPPRAVIVLGCPSGGCTNQPSAGQKLNNAMRHSPRNPDPFRQHQPKRHK